MPPFLRWNFSRARDPRNIVINRVPDHIERCLFRKHENCDVCLFFLSLFILVSFYLSLSLFLPSPSSSYSVIIFISSSPVFLLCVTSCPIRQSLVTTYGCYIIGHMVLIDMPLIDEWALVKSYLNAYLYIMKILKLLFATDQIKFLPSFFLFYIILFYYILLLIK